MFSLFYKECLNDWANYKAKSTLPTLCTGDALNETFWNNKVICVAEKPPFKKNLVNKGIIKLKLMLKLKQVCLNHGIRRNQHKTSAQYFTLLSFFDSMPSD